VRCRQTVRGRLPMVRYRVMVHAVRVSSSGGQGSSQSIDLLLQLGHSAVCLLLPFPRRGGDYALPIGFGTPLTGDTRMAVIHLAFDLQLPACLTGSRPFQVIGIIRLPRRTVFCRAVLLHLLLAAFIRFVEGRCCWGLPRGLRV
jgi:hypothetical protein